MKQCTRFHIEDVEPGDRLRLTGGSVQEFAKEPDPDVTITVRRAYHTHNFGWCVDAVEPRILPGDEQRHTYYLDDYDEVRLAEQVNQ